MRILLITASALALSAGAAMANDTTLTQNGANNVAAIDQTGGQEGVVEAVQTGAGSNLTVTQSENPVGSVVFNVPANQVDIEQINTGPGDNGPTAYVTQSSNNPGGLTNLATIRQQTDGDLADQVTAVNQAGSGNTVLVEQGSDPADTTGQYAEANQTGDANESTITQTGANVVATVSQVGDANTSLVTQSGFFSQAVVSQEADGNASTVDQSGPGDYAFVSQRGLGGHTSSVTQGPGTSDAFVEQLGEGNTSTVVQTASSSETAGGSAFAAYVRQYGVDGQSSITQGGDDNAASLYQLASSVGAASTITQNGTDGVVLVEQDGVGNTSTVNQLVGGVGNTATVNQLVGDNNVSFISQAGAGNVATVNQ